MTKTPAERHDSTLRPPRRPLDPTKIPAVSVGYGSGCHETGTWYRAYLRDAPRGQRDCRYFPPAPEGTIYLSPEERLIWLALRKSLFERS